MVLPYGDTPIRDGALGVFAMVMLNVFELERPPPVTVTTMLEKIPPAVGVPLMTPVELITVSPVGNPEALQLYGVPPPDALKG